MKILMSSSSTKMLLLIILMPLVAGSVPYQRLKEEHKVIVVNDISTETKQEIIDTINDYRRSIEPSASNMLRMIWSDEAAKAAKDWARECVGHSSSVKRVLNGFFCYESSLNSNYFISWPQILLVWYNNHTDEHYTFGQRYPKKFMSSHTQLILHNTYQVGCVDAFCPASKEPFFYVCFFCPAGYMPKQMVMPYKKGPPCGDCPNDCVDNLCTNPCKYVDYAWDCKQLKSLFNCNEDTMLKTCHATCSCNTEIV